jgi:hypothetical protein
MWTSDGKWLASSDRHVDNTFVSTAGGTWTFFWTMIQDDMRTLRAKLFPRMGPANSIARDANRQLSAGFARSGGRCSDRQWFCALWSDTRGSDFGQLYYQILDQAMSPVQQPNGISLCADYGNLRTDRISCSDA